MRNKSLEILDPFFEDGMGDFKATADSPHLIDNSDSRSVGRKRKLSFLLLFYLKSRIMLRYFHNISYRSFVTTTGSVSIALFTASYFHNLHQDYLQRAITAAAKMTVDQKIKTPFQVRVS